MALSRQGLLFTIMPLLALLVGLAALRPAHWDAERVIGSILTIVGFVLVTLARAQLGLSFSVTPQARALVTTGLYSRIRHPVYVFGAICIAGFVTYIGRPKLLLLFLVLMPIQMLRMQAEGRTLEEKFGEEYRQWKRRTWF